MRDTVIFAAFLLLLILAVVLLARLLCLEMTARRFPPPSSVEETSVSLILDFAWRAFSANRLSWRAPAIQPLRVIR